MATSYGHVSISLRRTCTESYGRSLWSLSTDTHAATAVADVVRLRLKHTKSVLLVTDGHSDNAVAA